MLFKGKTANEVLTRNKRQDPIQIVNQLRGIYNNDCVDLLVKMLSSPGHRPTAEQCLIHPWFKNDKDILSEMIFVNKRSASPINHDVNYDVEDYEEEKSDFNSFLIAPNYY